MASEEIRISGARACSASIQISGAKNAALPLMAACLLTDEEVVLENVPNINDVDKMKKQLESYGIRVRECDSKWVLRATRETKSLPRNKEGSDTRGSFLVLGPLLARLREAKVFYPGGCKISRNGRPVNFHIDALVEMGATVQSCGDYIQLNAVRGLSRAEIRFRRISVGATETVIMAACLADGQTVITNAAVEPEIMDLIKMLNAMGMNGDIRVDERRNKIVINGRNGVLLNGCTHTVMPDRIEAGTWAIAAAMTGGSLLLEMDPEIGKKIMKPVLQMLERAGVNLQWSRDGLEVQRHGQINPVNVTTGPFPQFPTDLLPQWTTFMTLANGSSMLIDTIYDSRFKHVQHLENMGAQFTKFSDQQYQVHGNARLKGKHVVATDLRAGAALVLAGLMAEGTTVVKEFQHVLRGYENIREKLGRWRVQTRDLPPTRSGFHGGNRSQFQEMGARQQDRQRR